MEYNEIKASVIPVFQRYGVEKAGLFGSYARGDTTDESDVDIVLEFKGDKSLLDLAGLKLDIEDALGKHVDVVTYKSIHPLLKDKILSEQKVLI